MCKSVAPRRDKGWAPLDGAERGTRRTSPPLGFPDAITWNGSGALKPHFGLSGEFPKRRLVPLGTETISCVGTEPLRDVLLRPPSQSVIRGAAPLKPKNVSSPTTWFTKRPGTSFTVSVGKIRPATSDRRSSIAGCRGRVPVPGSGSNTPEPVVPSSPAGCVRRSKPG